MALWLGGIGVSRGISMGPVRVLHELQLKIRVRQVGKDRVKAEIQRFRNALRRSIRELQRLQDHVSESLPGEAASYLDAQLMMLRDKALVDPVITWIRDKHYSAEWALALHRDYLLGLFEQIDDPYLRVRGGDIENIIGRIMEQLHGGVTASAASGVQVDQGYILVSHDLAPADLLMHRKDGMRGVLTERGSALSHTTILARSIGIPVVVGAAGCTGVLLEDEMLLLDGDTGMAVAGPDRRTLKAYQRRQRQQATRLRKLRALRHSPAKTRNRQRVRLCANIECADDTLLARRDGADAIGMFRTESLYQNRNDLPDEDEHYNLYRSVLKRMQGRPVTVRTMDLWASREIPGLARILPESDSPPLGMRAIRLCLRHPQVFEPQLRGLLRASTHGDLRILLPMVSSVDEIRQARRLLERLRLEIQQQLGKTVATPALGVMIEVPAAAIACGMFLRQVDFLAIGTNDLTQYTLAADRNDDQIQPIYDPVHPAVLILIRDTIRRGRRAGKPVSVCGEIAGDPAMTRLLLGLGLREFSMHPASLLEVKSVVMQSDTTKLEKPAGRILRCDSRAKSAQLLDTLNATI